MLDTVLLALFLPCLGMSAIFVVYMCLLYATTRHRSDSNPPLKPVTEKGLSPLDLEKLPKITGKELLAPTECAVCLDDIVDEQPARLLPGCNHAFHLQCADTWLSKHPMCPLCRAKLDPQSLNSESPCWTIDQNSLVHVYIRITWITLIIVAILNMHFMTLLYSCARKSWYWDKIIRNCRSYCGNFLKLSHFTVYMQMKRRAAEG